MSSEEPPSKRSRGENGVASKPVTVDSLQQEIAIMKDNEQAYYASNDCVLPQLLHGSIPQKGMPARHVQERIVQQQELDNRVRLNTSSYVNVVQEPEEEDVALRGLKVNLVSGG